MFVVNSNTIAHIIYCVCVCVRYVGLCGWCMTHLGLSLSVISNWKSRPGLCMCVCMRNTYVYRCTYLATEIEGAYYMYLMCFMHLHVHVRVYMYAYMYVILNLYMYSVCILNVSLCIIQYWCTKATQIYVRSSVHAAVFVVLYMYEIACMFVHMYAQYSVYNMYIHCECVCATQRHGTDVTSHVWTNTVTLVVSLTLAMHARDRVLTMPASGSTMCWYMRLRVIEIELRRSYMWLSFCL